MRPDALTAPATSDRSVRLLVLGGVATVMVGFLIGFAVGGRGGDRADDAVTASGGPTSAPASTTSTTASTTTTSSLPSTSTAAPTTTSTAPTATTVAPVITAAPVTSAVTSVPATTAPPPTYAPPRVVVSYAADGAGRLVVPRVGSATLVITNEGGVAQQWLVTGSGFLIAGANQGNLAPGQTVTVGILAPPTELPKGEVPGTISVLGAVNSQIPFVIAAA